VHFHYAGMVLPVLASCGVKHVREGTFTKLVMALVIVGVPAVALGITATQLAIAPSIEAIAALVLGLGGLGVAGIHFRLARQPKWPVAVRMLWLVSATGLSIGMILAALYGARSVALLIPWLDLPWMRALHGTANGIGFGLGGTIAWWKILFDNDLTIDQTWSSLST
jgi:YndJ-like protein